MERIFYGVREFGKLYGISKSKAAELVMSGRVKSVWLDGRRLIPSDEVRAVYRELAEVIGGEEVATPRWGYTHLGHEPQGRAYRITGRGTLSDLETQREHPSE